MIQAKNPSSKNNIQAMPSVQKKRVAERFFAGTLVRLGLHLALVSITAIGLFALLSSNAIAQDVNIDFGQGASITGRAVQIIALITVLSLAPSILVMATSFTRIVVVLSLLRSAIGLQTSPPNSVMVSLALFLTWFIMAPVFTQSYERGIQPLINDEIEISEAFEEGIKPFHAFMRQHVRQKDLALFMDMANEETPETPEEVSLRSLVPAFMISELRRAFEIGFLIYLPFIIIDLVVSSILMAMGMMMLPPVIISLPFKLIFFVLADGWHLLAGSLVQSFGT